MWRLLHGNFPLMSLFMHIHVSFHRLTFELLPAWECVPRSRHSRNQHQFFVDRILIYFSLLVYRTRSRLRFRETPKTLARILESLESCVLHACCYHFRVCKRSACAIIRSRWIKQCNVICALFLRLIDSPASIARTEREIQIYSSVFVSKYADHVTSLARNFNLGQNFWN